MGRFMAHNTPNLFEWTAQSLHGTCEFMDSTYVHCRIKDHILLLIAFNLDKMGQPDRRELRQSFYKSFYSIVNSFTYKHPFIDRLTMFLVISSIGSLPIELMNYKCLRFLFALIDWNGIFWFNVDLVGMGPIKFRWQQVVTLMKSMCQDWHIYLLLTHDNELKMHDNVKWDGMSSVARANSSFITISLISRNFKRLSRSTTFQLIYSIVLRFRIVEKTNVNTNWRP